MSIKVIDFYLPPYFRPPLNKQLPLCEIPYILSKESKREINKKILLISNKASQVFLSDYEYFDFVGDLLDKGYTLSSFSRRIIDKNSRISLNDSNQYITFSSLIEKNVRLKENVEENLERSKNIAYRVRDFVDDFRFFLALKF